MVIYQCFAGLPSRLEIKVMGESSLRGRFSDRMTSNGMLSK